MNDFRYSIINKTACQLTWHSSRFCGFQKKYTPSKQVFIWSLRCAQLMRKLRTPWALKIFWFREKKGIFFITLKSWAVVTFVISSSLMVKSRKKLLEMFQHFLVEFITQVKTIPNVYYDVFADMKTILNSYYNIINML